MTHLKPHKPRAQRGITAQFWPSDWGWETRDLWPRSWWERGWGQLLWHGGIEGGLHLWLHWRGDVGEITLHHLWLSPAEEKMAPGYPPRGSQSSDTSEWEAAACIDDIPTDKRLRIEFKRWNHAILGLVVVLTVLIHINENEELNIEKKNPRDYRIRLEQGVFEWRYAN